MHNGFPDDEGMRFAPAEARRWRMGPTAGDLLIISHWGVLYDVARVGGDVIGRTTSKRDAVVLAFGARPPGRVWEVEVGGTPMPVESPPPRTHR